MAPKTTTEAAPPSAPGSTTIGGHAVQILAFIPDNPKNMRGQAELLNLLADLKDGTKTIADLTPHLRAIEVKANYVRKRFTLDEAKALFEAKPAAVDLEPKTPEEAIAKMTAAGSASPEDEARLNYPELFAD